jgi:hypothetical protein
MAQYFMEQHVPTPGQIDHAKALLAASKTGAWDLRSRQRFLELAATLAEDTAPLHLRAEIGCRRSTLIRLRGDVQGSNCIISAFLSNTKWSDLSPEDLAVLYLSQANNRTYHFNFVEAHRAAQEWAPTEKLLPGRHESLLWDQAICVGRIFRGEGYFEAAKICFETCLATPRLNPSRTFLIKSALADLYCELAYLATDPNSYLAEAEAIVEPEIQGLD